MAEADVAGRPGPVGPGYRAAVEACALFDRSRRRRWVVEGRNPGGMLEGIVTSSLPEPLEPGPGAHRGRAVYGATLTPKGKIVSDHRMLRLGADGAGLFLLDVPAEGVDGLRAHFDRFLPPRFATIRDVSASTAMWTVVGPEAPSRIAAVLAERGLGREADDGGAELGEMAEGELRILEARKVEGDTPASGRVAGVGEQAGQEAITEEAPAGELALQVIRSGDLGRGPPPAFDVVGPRGLVSALAASLLEAGCAELDAGSWEALRVEGGRPAFGRDMDTDTLPVEAGIHDRAIDYAKGCYTGQEVIVRIRDRGRVNRHLRGLLFGDGGGGGAPPEPGTELFRRDGGRVVGWVTSAVESPRFGQAAGLGYVRREVAPDERVRVGAADGAEARVVELGPDGWITEG